MKKGDIVTVMTMAGEFIGKFSAYREDGTVVVEDPRCLVNGQNGMGFAKGICMTGPTDPKKVTFGNFIFVTETDESFANEWRKAVTGIDLGASVSKKIIT